MCLCELESVFYLIIKILNTLFSSHHHELILLCMLVLTILCAHTMQHKILEYLIVEDKH